MKTLDVANLDRLRVVHDRHSVGRTYNKLVLEIKAEAIGNIHENPELLNVDPIQN